MPPGKYSRHGFCLAVNDTATPDQLQLTERVPYGFQAFPDNIQHVVAVGDTLWSLASYYFEGVSSRPALLWWVIADFQPDPIIDPTIALVIGTTLIIPSERTLTDEVFNPTRANETDD